MGKRILIVDDHPMVRTGLSLAVQDVEPDCTIDQTASIEDANARLHETGYDLILLDILVPGAGDDPIGRVVSAADGAKVLAVSMLEKPSDIRKALDAGAAGYLPKSSSPAITRHAIRLTLDGEAYIPPQILEADGAGIDRPELPDKPSRYAAMTMRGIGLTRMQSRVLEEMAQGASNQQIADRLSLSISTVKAHVGAVIKKLNVQNRTQAVLKAQNEGIVKQ